jgi:hypothetical protein
MKRISSKSTFFNKKIFPVIWFGFLALFVLFSLLSAGDKPFNPMIIIVPVILAAFGYFVMKKLVFDLMDEVYDDGESLLFKNSGKEVRVYLKDIKSATYHIRKNPSRVTLSIRYKTPFGDELSFLPRTSLIPFMNNREIEELIERIECFDYTNNELNRD